MTQFQKDVLAVIKDGATTEQVKARLMARLGRDLRSIAGAAANALISLSKQGKIKTSDPNDFYSCVWTITQKEMF